MRVFTAAMAGASLMLATLMPAQVAAEAKVYPYHGQNFCPAGYQPVVVGGVICCGQPTQHRSYQQALAHPTPKKKRHVRHTYSARPSCTAGTKGC